MEWADVIPNERLLFGDFLEPNAERRVYRMVHDLPAMEATVTDYLQVRRSQLRCSSAHAKPFTRASFERVRVKVRARANPRV